MSGCAYICSICLFYLTQKEQDLPLYIKVNFVSPRLSFLYGRRQRTFRISCTVTCTCSYFGAKWDYSTAKLAVALCNAAIFLYL